LELSDQLHSAAALPREKSPLPIKYEAGCFQKPVLDFKKSEKFIACFGIRIPNQSTRSLFCVPTILVLKQLFRILLNRASWDSVAGIVTRFWLDGLGIEAWWARFSEFVQTNPLANTAPYKSGTLSFPGVKAAGAWR